MFQGASTLNLIVRFLGITLVLGAGGPGAGRGRGPSYNSELGFGRDCFWLSVTRALVWGAFKKMSKTSPLVRRRRRTGRHLLFPWTFTEVPWTFSTSMVSS